MRFDPAIFLTNAQQTPRQLRISGAVMLVLGGFIVVGGVALGWVVLDLPIPVEWLPDGTRFEPAPEGGLAAGERLGSSVIVLLILASGLASVLQGLWQLILGRRNRLMLRIIVGVTIVVVVLGVVASFVTGCPIGRICH